jgi:hypothetical protein
MSPRLLPLLPVVLLWAAAAVHVCLGFQLSQGGLGRPLTVRRCWTD